MGAWAHRRVFLVALLGSICAYAPTRLSAQTPDSINRPRIPPVVRYGKWVALGGAAALGFVAHSRNQDADARYQALRDRCFDDPTFCQVGPNGHYLDPVSERLYTDTRRLDREAARFLISAEVAVAATAVGFVWEVMHREDRPPTIPFQPRIEAGLTTTRVGLTFHF